MGCPPPPYPMQLRSPEGQDTPNPQPGGAEPPPAAEGSYSGGMAPGGVWGSRTGGAGTSAEVRTCQSILPSRAMGRAVPAAASVAEPRTPGRGAARLRTASAPPPPPGLSSPFPNPGPCSPPAPRASQPRERNEKTILLPRGCPRQDSFSVVSSHGRSPPLDGSHRTAAEPGHFKAFAADPSFLLPLRLPGGWGCVYVCVFRWLLAPGASLTDGSLFLALCTLRWGQRPLGRRWLHLTAPAGSELPPPPPRLPHPRGLETSDSSRAVGIHISITALFEVGGGVDTCRGLRVCQSQPSAPPQPRCWGVGWGCAIERSAPAQLLPPFQPLLLQEARRKRAHSAAGVSPTY